MRRLCIAGIFFICFLRIFELDCRGIDTVIVKVEDFSFVVLTVLPCGATPFLNFLSMDFSGAMDVQHWNSPLTVN